ncbi:MAG: hypothetical protein AAB373_00415 [Patescibacteria group bacterium]
MENSIIDIRPVQEDDAEGLASSNSSLNSPHAPTNLAAVRRIIAASQGSISGKGNPTQVNVVAEERFLNGESRIVGGGALVKMGSDGEYPILWRPNADGSLTRSRYTDPTLEFGGVSVARDAQGKGVGKGITAARALIAKRYGALFGVRNVLSDFLPPLNNVDTKENAFWDDMIVELLRENGNLAEVMAYCQEKTGISISDTTTLSSVIGNIMSDADRNVMVDRFFPKDIPAERITPEIQTIMENVNGPTEAARANLIKIFGNDFRIIGVFPINGGPNYVAPVEKGPIGEGPTPLQVRDELVNRVKILLFRPLAAGFEGLRNFKATLVDGEMNGNSVTVSKTTAQIAGFIDGENLMKI